MVPIAEVTPALVKVTDPPRDTAPPPDIPVPAVTVTEELINFEFEIDPASIPSVTFRSPIVVAKLPVPLPVTSPVRVIV